METHHFAVTGGFTLEICFAQFWSVQGNSQIELQVELHGVSANIEQPHIQFPTPYRLDLYSALRTETVNISARFQNLKFLLTRFECE